MKAKSISIVSFLNLHIENNPDFFSLLNFYILINYGQDLLIENLIISVETIILKKIPIIAINH